jgi:murein DD-endopeptidase MepM/ murein hydrolase activator NlpD
MIVKRVRPYIILSGAALLVALFFSQFWWQLLRNTGANLNYRNKIAEKAILQDIKYGIDFNAFDVMTYHIETGDVLGKILVAQGMDGDGLQKVLDHCDGVFKFNSLRPGKSMVFLFDKATKSPAKLIYDYSPYEYVVMDLTGEYAVKVEKRPVTTAVNTTSGIIESSFWQALTDNGVSDELADAMIDVFAFSVNFHQQKVGDKFKLIFEEYTVNGKQVGTGKILAAMYEREGKQFFAFNHDDAQVGAKYFDFDGRPAKRAFLKAPVKFSRISSRFSNNRFHPLLGYNRPHHGTDFAAPHGSNILAISDGVVTEATRKGGNGNYVKIRHDKTYESQYLHMSGFAKGIRPGTKVTQGQLIGYVGSTGLSTGPHVCFRFWKSGHQVDFLKQNLPNPQAMVGASFEAFKSKRDVLANQLEGIPFRSREDVMKAHFDEQFKAKVNP